MPVINPFTVIAKAAKLNPVVTKIIIVVPALLACVAIGTTLVADVATAIIGSILTIIAAVLLVIVSAIGPALGGLAIWFARFCLTAFCAVTTTLFTSWGWDVPKPTGCLLRPTEPCVTDLRKSEPGAKTVSDASTLKLEKYLFPPSKSGVIDKARAAEFRKVLDQGGNSDLNFGAVLMDPGQAKMRNELITKLGLHNS
jgi:hypothetical protein